MESKYDQKFEEMKKYIPFLDSMIQRLENSGLASNPRQAQLDKFRWLRGALLNKKKRLTMETLAKCEQVLIYLHAKIEQRDLNSMAETENATSETDKTHLQAVRNKLKSVVSKLNVQDNTETLPEIAGTSKVEEVCVPGSKEPALFQRRPNKGICVGSSNQSISSVTETQQSKKNYTHVLHSPGVDNDRCWSTSEKESDNVLFSRRSPRRHTPSYNKKERKKSKQIEKYDETKKLNITLNSSQESLSSLNTKYDDVDINTLRNLKSQILGELKNTDDVSDIILKSYKKKNENIKNYELEDGELSDSENEDNQGVNSSLVVMGKDENTMNSVNKTSKDKAPREIKIKQIKSNISKKNIDVHNPIKIDITDFESYHNDGKHDDCIGNKNSNVINEQSISDSKTNDESVFLKFYSPGQSSVDEVSNVFLDSTNTNETKIKDTLNTQSNEIMKQVTNNNHQLISDDMEDGVLSGSKSEDAQSVALVEMDKDKNTVNPVNETSNYEDPRENQICLVINNKQIISNISKENKDVQNPIKVDITDFESYHNDDKHNDSIENKNSNVINEQSISNAKTNDESVSTKLYSPGQSSVDKVSNSTNANETKIRTTLNMQSNEIAKQEINDNNQLISTVENGKDNATCATKHTENTGNYHPGWDNTMKSTESYQHKWDDDRKKIDKRIPVWEDNVKYIEHYHPARNDPRRNIDKRIISVWEDSRIMNNFASRDMSYGGNNVDSYQQNYKERYRYDNRESYNKPDCPQTPIHSFGRLDCPSASKLSLRKSDWPMALVHSFDRSYFRRSINQYGINSDPRRFIASDYNNRDDGKHRRFFNDRNFNTHSYRPIQNNRVMKNHDAKEGKNDNFDTRRLRAASFERTLVRDNITNNIESRFEFDKKITTKSNECRRDNIRRAASVGRELVNVTKNFRDIKEDLKSFKIVSDSKLGYEVSQYKENRKAAEVASSCDLLMKKHDNESKKSSSICYLQKDNKRVPILRDDKCRDDSTRKNGRKSRWNDTKNYGIVYSSDNIAKGKALPLGYGLKNYKIPKNKRTSADTDPFEATEMTKDSTSNDSTISTILVKDSSDVSNKNTINAEKSMYGTLKIIHPKVEEQNAKIKNTASNVQETFSNSDSCKGFNETVSSDPVINNINELISDLDQDFDVSKNITSNINENLKCSVEPKNDMEIKEMSKVVLVSSPSQNNDLQNTVSKMGPKMSVELEISGKNESNVQKSGSVPILGIENSEFKSTQNVSTMLKEKYECNDIIKDNPVSTASSTIEPSYEKSEAVVAKIGETTNSVLENAALLSTAKTENMNKSNSDISYKEALPENAGEYLLENNIFFNDRNFNIHSYRPIQNNRVMKNHDAKEGKNDNFDTRRLRAASFERTLVRDNISNNIESRFEFDKKITTKSNECRRDNFRRAASVGRELVNVTKNFRDIKEDLKSFKIVSDSKLGYKVSQYKENRKAAEVASSCDLLMKKHDNESKKSSSICYLQKDNKRVPILRDDKCRDDSTRKNGRKSRWNDTKNYGIVYSSVNIAKGKALPLGYGLKNYKIPKNKRTSADTDPSEATEMTKDSTSNDSTISTILVKDSSDVSNKNTINAEKSMYGTLKIIHSKVEEQNAKIKNTASNVQETFSNSDSCKGFNETVSSDPVINNINELISDLDHDFDVSKNITSNINENLKCSVEPKNDMEIKEMSKVVLVSSPSQNNDLQNTVSKMGPKMSVELEISGKNESNVQKSGSVPILGIENSEFKSTQNVSTMLKEKYECNDIIKDNPVSTASSTIEPSYEKSEAVVAKIGETTNSVLENAVLLSTAKTENMNKSNSDISYKEALPENAGEYLLENNMHKASSGDTRIYIRENQEPNKTEMSKKNDSMHKLLSLLQDKSKMMELISKLSRDSIENEKIKKKLEKLSEIVSEDEDAKQQDRGVAILDSKGPATKENNYEKTEDKLIIQNIESTVIENNTMLVEETENTDINMIGDRDELSKPVNFLDNNVETTEITEKEETESEIDSVNQKEMQNKENEKLSSNIKELQLNKETLNLSINTKADKLHSDNINLEQVEDSLNCHTETDSNCPKDEKPKKKKYIKKRGKKNKKEPAITQKKNTLKNLLHKIKKSSRALKSALRNIDEFIKDGDLNSPEIRKLRLLKIKYSNLDPYIFETDSVNEGNASERKNESESESESELQRSSALNSKTEKKIKIQRGVQAGIIKTKNRRKERVSSDAHGSLDNVKNPDLECFTDKSYCFKSKTSTYFCRLCNYTGSDIVPHYKKHHPHTEIPVSRFSPSAAKRAIKQCELVNFQAIRKMPTDKYTCRFCYKNFVKQELEKFFWHVVSMHTGEYVLTTPELYQCSECLDTAMCPFSIDIPPPPAYAKGQLLGHICGKCNFTQVSIENLKTHVKKRHNEEETKVYTISLSILSKKAILNYLKDLDTQNSTSQDEEPQTLGNTQSKQNVTECCKDNTLKYSQHNIKESPREVKNLLHNIHEFTKGDDLNSLGKRKCRLLEIKYSDFDPYVFETDSVNEDNASESNNESDSELESELQRSSALNSETEKKIKIQGVQAGFIKTKNRRKERVSSDAHGSLDNVKIPDLECFTDKSYCFKSKISTYSCRLCNYTGSDIIPHYKKHHPHTEIPLSRLSPSAAKRAIKQCELGNFQAIRKMPTDKYTCRFCYKNFVKQQLKEFFWHVVSMHTGEYVLTTPELHQCSECLDTAKCPFSIDIPTPPEYAKGQLLGHICGKCNFTQVSIKNLETHVMKRHNDEETKVYTISLSILSKKVILNYLKDLDTQNPTSQDEEPRRLGNTQSKQNVTECCKDNTLKYSQHNIKESPREVKNLLHNIHEFTKGDDLNSLGKRKCRLLEIKYSDFDPYVFETDSVNEDNASESNNESDSELESELQRSSALNSETEKKIKIQGVQAGFIKTKNRRKERVSSDAHGSLDNVKIPDLECFTDKSYCFKSKISTYSCRLCNYTGSDIIPHYKKHHPHTEIPLSRLSPSAAKRAIKQCELGNFQAIRKMPTDKYTCRFCYKNFVKQQLKEFFWHVVSMHTGEYVLTTPELHQCSECLDTAKCPFSIDIPTPPEYAKGQLLGHICGKCNFTQVSIKNLETHVMKRHNDEETKVYTISLSILSKKAILNYLKDLDTQNPTSQDEEPRRLGNTQSKQNVTECSKDSIKSTEKSKNPPESVRIIQSKLTFEDDNLDDISYSKLLTIDTAHKTRKDPPDSDVLNKDVESNNPEQMQIGGDRVPSSDIFSYPHFKIQYTTNGLKEYVCCINGNDNHYKTTLSISMKRHIQLKHSENWDGYCFMCKVIVTPQETHQFKDCFHHYFENHIDDFPIANNVASDKDLEHGQVIEATKGHTTECIDDLKPPSQIVSTQNESQKLDESNPGMPIIESVKSLRTADQSLPSPSYPSSGTPEVAVEYKYEEAQADIMSKKHCVVLDTMMTHVNLIQIFKCAGKFCSFTTDSAEEALLHSSAHVRIGGEYALCCVYCNFDASGNAIDLVTHVFKNHGCCPYVCEVCFYRAAASQLVQAHINRVHPDKSARVLRTPVVKGTIEDEICLSRKLAVPFYVCKGDHDTQNPCKFKTYTPSKFFEHMQQRHQNSKDFLCFICTEALSSPSDLIHHLKTHGLNLYQCTWCVYGADSETELLKHSSAKHPSKQPKAFLRIISKKQGSNEFKSLPLVHLDKNYITVLEIQPNVITKNPVQEAKRAIELEKLIGETTSMVEVTSTLINSNASNTASIAKETNRPIEFAPHLTSLLTKAPALPTSSPNLTESPVNKMLSPGPSAIMAAVTNIEHGTSKSFKRLNKIQETKTKRKRSLESKTKTIEPPEKLKKN